MKQKNIALVCLVSAAVASMCYARPEFTLALFSASSTNSGYPQVMLDDMRAAGYSVFRMVGSRCKKPELGDAEEDRPRMAEGPLAQSARPVPGRRGPGRLAPPFPPGSGAGGMNSEMMGYEGPKVLLTLRIHRRSSQTWKIEKKGK